MNLSDVEKFKKLAPPDEDGFSREVPIEELENNGLWLGNGGSWCRKDSKLGREFNVVRHKKGKGNKITSVQLCGFKK